MHSFSIETTRKKGQKEKKTTDKKRVLLNKPAHTHTQTRTNAYILLAMVGRVVLIFALGEAGGGADHALPQRSLRHRSHYSFHPLFLGRDTPLVSGLPYIGKNMSE